jgi:hypothetical protein
MRKNKVIDVVCDHCSKTFSRALKEVTRSQKLGRRNFCSRSCCGKASNDENSIRRIPEEKRLNAWKYVKKKNRTTKESPFRFFIKSVKNHCRHYDVEIDLHYLMELWDFQSGICPITGWKLDLPHGSIGWKTPLNNKRASVDRIDNDKGYVKGNVRFISYMANVARNRMSDEELIEFCKAVASHNS